ncbi:MAG: hypothetical protein HZC28_17525 [Spirochaetes bacterium]|nr:hypothetical protein [Spirochaetota bacterium]
MGLSPVKTILMAVFAVGALCIVAAAPTVTKRSGDKMTFSNRDQTVTYEGNATFIDGGNRIISDIMRFQLDENRAYCQGNVRIFLTNNVLITAGRVDYSEQSKLAKVTQRPVLRMRDEQVTIRSERMERALDADITRAVGDVSIERVNQETGETVYGYGGILSHASGNNIVTLSDSPRIIHKGNTITGEVMEYTVARESIEVYGDARIRFRPRGEGDENLENTIAGDRVYYIKDNISNFVRAYGSVKVHIPKNNIVIRGGFAAYDIDSSAASMRESPVVHFLERESSIAADTIDYATVDEKDIVDFTGNVLIVENRSGLIVTAGQLKSFINDGYSKITVAPVAYLTREDVIVTAVYFEQFEAKHKMRANGNVVVRREAVTAYADIAVYDIQANTIKLWGGIPKLVQEGRIINAREITMDVKTGRVELTQPQGAFAP